MSRSATDAAEAAALLRRYEPVVRLTRGELFHPGSVEDYLRSAALIAGSGESARVLAEPGTLTPAALAELGARHRGEPLSLRYVQQPLAAREYRRWRRTEAPERLRRSSGAAAAGLVARLVPTLLRLSLVLRGAVPGGWTAAAYRQSRTVADPDACHYYGRVVRDGGYVVLQYWFFYPMNDWRSSFGGVNDHEADWEQVAVVLAGEEGGLTPAWVLFASHDETGADRRRRWDDPDLEVVGDHPVVHVGAGSHSTTCLPGDYLVTVSPELPAWVDRLRRRAARILPWSDPEARGIGIPYVDYHRGDGLTIGPGQDRGWHQEVVDDDTPWVRHYRGLWGLDTRDPLGGERAPAGPRYERTGAVRQSWAQPLAWAGLDGEPATIGEARALWRDRPRQLTARLAAVEEQLRAERARLRGETVADRVAGRPPRRPGRERAELQRRVAALRERQARLAEDLESHGYGDVRLPEPGPHDHLSHRPVPLSRDTTARARALLVWASASSTVLFAALGSLLVLGQVALLLPALAIVVAVLLVEAALRRHLVGLLVNLALAAGVLVLVWTLARLLLDNLRLGVGVLLLLTAAYMAVQTVSDALVHRRSGRRD